MSTMNTTPAAPNWGAVYAVCVSVAGLLTAEFLPVSILTPMAQGLDITEGLAGQSVAATAFAAIFASLFVTTLTRGIDRRFVVFGFSILLIASSLIVALASGFAMMLVGRLLLGLALGGFWAMAASLAMRLVPPTDVPKALSIIFSGVSVSMVIAAPLGSYLGGMIGWRGVFLLAAAVGVLCLIWQICTLPSMPARRQGHVGAVFALLGRTGVKLPMLAIFTVFAGQFAFFTYLRPLLEQVSLLGVEGVSAMLLLFGISNFVGTTMSSLALRASLKATLALAPLLLALCAAALAILAQTTGAVAVVLALWGFGFGMVPVAWSTWVTKRLSDDAENAGGLQVAVIQLANAAGAALGGLVLDAAGPIGPVLFGGLLLFVTAAIVAMGVRTTAPELEG